MNTKKITILFIILIFTLGWLCNNAFTSIASTISISTIPLDQNTQKPNPTNKEFNVLNLLKVEILKSAKERNSPFDRIQEKDIRVYEDHVKILIENPQWSTFTDTNSMDPILDKGANAIQIVPKSENEIHLGDIISYQSPYSEDIIIHRVIKIGYDHLGWYAIAKGDNLEEEDPEKIRFEQIKRVVIAIIY
jgi:hypothetical protein